MVDLIEHLESFLGHMSGGSRGDETTPEGVQVAWFPDSPFAGVTTLVTVGLSRRHLAMPDGGVPITAGEAEVIREDGWKALEQVFVAQDPDLSDPGRPAVVLREPGS